MLNKLIKAPGYVLGGCTFDGRYDNNGIQTYTKEEVFCAPFNVVGHRILIKYRGYTGASHTDGWERQGITCVDVAKELIVTGAYQEIDSFHTLEAAHGNDHYFDGKLEIKAVANNFTLKMSYKFNDGAKDDIHAAWGFSIHIY